MTIGFSQTFAAVFGEIAGRTAIELPARNHANRLCESRFLTSTVWLPHCRSSYPESGSAADPIRVSKEKPMSMANLAIPPAHRIS